MEYDMNRFKFHGDHCVVYDNALILKPEMISLGDHVRIDSFCRLEGGLGLYIGDYVHIPSFGSVLGGGTCHLGNYFGMSQGAKIVTGTERGSRVMSAAAPNELRDVKRSLSVCGDYSFMGVNSVLLIDVHLGKGAVLGAGAVAVKDIPNWEIWGGVPAIKIGERKPFEVKGGKLFYL
jgi:galactoside O-acetyltransferase